MTVINIIRKINEAAVIIVLALIWMVMLGSAVMMRKGGHLAIDLVTASLPERIKKATDFIVFVSIIVFFSIVCYQGIFLTINAGRQTSPALNMPMSYVYASLPVGGALILMETVIRFIGFLKGGFRGAAQPEAEAKA